MSSLASVSVLSWFILLSATALDVQAAETGDILFSDCAISLYYDSLNSRKNMSDWTRTDLGTLMQETHERVLPYTDSYKDDVWKALMDLDVGDSGEGTVRLIYRATDFPSKPHGEPSTWNREHLWPKSLGVDYSGADFTDIHHLRPSDWNVNAARNNKFFGECGLVEDMSTCTVPATAEAANDTASDPSIFFPPLINRGEIARALFYMDVRYSGNDGGLDLQLTDCPTKHDGNGDDYNEMAYLSQLLEWHQQFPPSERERRRNTRACERWQGNRNVFVDFPSLVELVFGKAQSPLGNGLGYACDAAQSLPTPAPAGQAPNGSNNSSTGTTCASLSPGAIMIVTLNSDDPDLVAMVALDDLPSGMPLYMTDNAWTGTGFRTNEGTLKMTTPDGGFPRGTMFWYDGSSSEDLLQYASLWQSVAGSFSLAAAGDTVMIYCTYEDDDFDVASNIRHLSAFSYSGNWAQSGLSENEYGTDSSALPESLLLAGAATTLPHFDNYMYDGSRTSGTKSTLLGAIVQESHWLGSNNERYSTDSQISFEVEFPSAGKKKPAWLALGLQVPVVYFASMLWL